MAENSEYQPEALFRPSKRRKVFRKRHVEDDQDGSAEPDRSDGDTSAAQDDSNELQPVVRRPVPKKHGISFSSAIAANQDVSSQDDPNGLALVPVEKEAGRALQSDRFTKPTGNVGVVEDKHLTAYVDSKLAELRSSSATPLASRTSPTPASHFDDNSSSQTPNPAGLESLAGTEATSRNDTTQGQRKGYPYGFHNRNRKPRRRPHVRDASDIARDAMVDAIMKESQVPLYDQSAATASNPAMDNDEAAAEAFKAQFLLEMEQKKRRKPPAPPAAGHVSSGPKLGGSRSQREKMRALEEAKNAAGKK